MLRFLFDTDHLTLYERGHLPVVQRVAVHGLSTVAVSAVTVEEALRGRVDYLRRALPSAARVGGYALLLGTVQLLNLITLVPFDAACEAQCQQLRALRPRVGAQDLRIAAVALVNKLLLVTRNRRDFSLIPGVQLADRSI